MLWELRAQALRAAAAVSTAGVASAPAASLGSDVAAVLLAMPQAPGGSALHSRPAGDGVATATARVSSPGRQVQLAPPPEPAAAAQAAAAVAAAAVAAATAETDAPVVIVAAETGPVRKRFKSSPPPAEAAAAAGDGSIVPAPDHSRDSDGSNKGSGSGGGGEPLAVSPAAPEGEALDRSSPTATAAALAGVLQTSSGGGTGKRALADDAAVLAPPAKRATPRASHSRSNLAASADTAPAAAPAAAPGAAPALALNDLNTQLGLLYRWYSSNTSAYMDQAQQLLQLVQRQKVVQALSGSAAAAVGASAGELAVLKAFEKAMEIIAS